MKALIVIHRLVYKIAAALVLIGALSPHALADGFGLKAGADAFVGTVGNASDSIKSRSINGVGIYAMPGYEFSQFLAGAIFEYSFIGQSTEPSAVGDTNLRGSGYLVGAAFAYTDGMIHALVSYDMYGVYTLTNKTGIGQTSAYTKPAGLRLNLGYRLNPMFSVDAFYSDASYSDSSLDGVGTDISSDKLKIVRYGAGLTYHWK